MIQQAQHKNFIKKLLSSKLFLFCLSLTLIALAISVGRESYRRAQLTKEIDKLKLETERLEGKKYQLSELLDSFKEESYLEKEARLKLNLKKPGEKVVILPQSERKDSSVSTQKEINSTSLELSSDKSAEEESNLWKWWEYFFEE